MKNKKFLKAIAAITLSASAALGAFGLTACGGGHSHSFKWESDATEHWKVCDCGDEECSSFFLPIENKKVLFTNNVFQSNVIALRAA